MARSGQTKAIAALLYSGQLQEATAACEAVLKQHPNDDEVLALHGQSLAQQRQQDAAMVSLMKAARIEPKRPEYVTLLGELHMNCGRFRDALTQFDKALKIRSDYDPAVAGKTNTYLRMGQPKKARRTIDKRLAIGPASAPIAVVHARVLTKLKENDAAVQTLDPWLGSDELPVENRRSLWFALGDAHEKAQRYQDAHAAYEHANGLAGARWDRSQDEAFHASIESICTREALDAAASSDVDGSRHVFIVGMPRCGSTLTEQIIHSHGNAHGVGESERLPELISTMAQRDGIDAAWPTCVPTAEATALTAIANEYMEHVGVHAGGATRIIDKQLGNYLFTGWIPNLLPGARIIHCQRHPMDMCLSSWTKQFPPGTNGWADTLTGAGQLYRLYEQLMDHWRTTCGDQLLEIHYEDLVADLEGTARRVLAFCELDWDPACLRFWENKRTALTLSNDQVRQPVYQSAKGRHVAWGDLLEPLRTALGDSVERYESR